MRIHLHILLLAAFSFANVLAQSLSFVRADPIPTRTWLADIAFGGGVFVVLSDGKPIYSLDGAHTFSRGTTSATNLSAVTFGGGKFVAVGDNRQIISSDDGITWTLRYSENSPSWNSTVDYAGSRFFTRGLTSSDAITWEPVPVTHVAYMNGKYFCLGGPSYGLESVDGKNWTVVTNDIPNTASYNAGCDGIVAFAGQFIARLRSVFGGASLLSSPDGRTWSTSIFTQYAQNFDKPFALTVVSDKMVSLGGSYVTVFSSFTVPDYYASPATLWKIVGQVGEYVGLAYTPQSGPEAIWRTGRIETYDVNDWQCVSPPEANLVSIAADGNTVVAVQDVVPAIVVSLNGLKSTFSATVPAGTGGLKRVRFGNGAFLAVGASGTVLRSLDGVNWTKRVSNTTSDLFDLAYGAGVWVAVGANGKVLTSSDGSAFTLRTSGTELRLQGVIYSGKQFVAVGLGGSIVTSPNGIDWNSAGDEAIDLFSVAYGNGIYVATGTNATVRTSTDGVTWQTRKLPGATSLGNVAFQNGFFVTMPNPASGFYSSRDGVSWSASTLEGQTSLFGVDSSGGEIWLVGAKSVIWKTNLGPSAGPRLRAETDSAGHVILTLLSASNGDYAIESKTDLQSGAWQNEATLTGVVSSASWTNSTPSGKSVFYRASKL